MYITSIYWDEKNGVCLKHLIPQLPCPTCLAIDDQDVERRPTIQELEHGFTIEELVQDFECVENGDGFDDNRSWEELPEVDGTERRREESDEDAEDEDERFDGDVDHLTYPEYA